MKLISVVALASLAVALPSTSVTVDVEATSGPHINATVFTAQQAHDNILATFPKHLIIKSADLHGYLTKNVGANHLIYLEEEGKFIDMSKVHVLSENITSHGKRQGSVNPCFGYTRYWAKQHSSWWDRWNPASSCVYTGYDPAGASRAINWSRSKSIEISSGLEWSAIKDILGVSVGFSVTQTWTHGGSMTCNIPGNSVGQIWLQNKLAWGLFWSEGCQSCVFGGGCGGRFGHKAQADGSATAPAQSTSEGDGVQYGCSTGKSRVRC